MLYSLRRHLRRCRIRIKKLLRRNRGLLFLSIGLSVCLLVLMVVLLTAGKSDDTPTAPQLGENKTVINLLSGGDLNITEKVIASGKRTDGEGYDFTAPFLDVAHLFAQADGAMLNFEGNLGNGLNEAPLQLPQTLSNMGVDFVQMANSFSIRKGISGLSANLNGIRSAGLEPLGAYATNKEFSNAKGYTIRNIGGIRVALVAFTKGMDGMGLPMGSENCVNLLYTDYTSTYQKINTQGITSILQAAQEQAPDITIALLHWGSEGNSTISPTQKKIVKLMQNNGVDVILGTHSHQVQPVEYSAENNTLVAYSLGDFYGDATMNGSQYSILLNIEISKDNDTGVTAVTGWDYIPIYTLTPERDGVSMQVVRIQQALELYENNHISGITPTAYENMKNALERIAARILPVANDN